MLNRLTVNSGFMMQLCILSVLLLEADLTEEMAHVT